MRLLRSRLQLRLHAVGQLMGFAGQSVRAHLSRLHSIPDLLPVTWLLGTASAVPVPPL